MDNKLTGMMPTFGLKVVTDINLVEPGESYEVPRMWKERLFTLPWRPFKKTRTVIPMVPSMTVYRYGDKLIMHPAMLEEYKRIANN
jgi:hypothetical protein